MSTGTIFTGTLYHTLEETLSEFPDDELSGATKMVAKKWLGDMFGRPMRKHMETDLEFGGPALLSEKNEGETLSPVTVKEGAVWTYLARTIAGSITATEEILEDNLYPEVIKAAARLSSAYYLTVDVDCTNMKARAQNADYTGGDGVSLASASHTLPDGGTWSNQMAVPLPPSVLLVSTARTAVRKFPGHNGYTGFGGYELKLVTFPVEQETVWEQLVNSEKTPTAGNFAEINIVPRMGLKTVPDVYWTNTTTNCMFITDCSKGVQHRWRAKPKSRTYVTDGNQSMTWAIRGRHATGWSDPRGVFFNGA